MNILEKELMAEKGKVKSSAILLVHALIALASGCLMRFVRYILQPVKRGFFCGDTSIRLPYRSSSIPFSIFSLIVFPIVVLTLAIFFRKFRNSEKEEKNGIGNQKTVILVELYVRSRKLRCYKEKYEINGRILDTTLVRMIQFFLIFVLGFSITGWFASFVKNSTGRLRPHFLDVCKPNVDLKNCSAFQFIDEYVCSSPESSSKIIDSRLSFFSGHSSSAFYCAAFLAIYIHARVGQFEVSWTPFFALIYAIFFVCAALVGISRVVDHKHHTSDVVVGGFVGIVMAALMVYCNNIF
uniref:Phosphatidic acid phosphatase type 2/haloperoxidase domain-containing protein n=1 Tax=Ditylenchus dipsaci TaxID=166011 RepID=A0A915DSI0_9BILA